MRRHLFTLLSAVSLLLCMAACVMWWRSPRYHDVVQCDRRSGLWWRLDSYPGVARWATGRNSGGWRNGIVVMTGAQMWECKLEVTPFEYYPRQRVALNDVYGGSLFLYDATVLLVPYRTIVLLSAVLPTTWLSARLLAVVRRRRRRAGRLCSSCGYDLRATPDRCPECGKIVDRQHHSGSTFHITVAFILSAMLALACMFFVWRAELRSFELARNSEYELSCRINAAQRLSKGDQSTLCELLVKEVPQGDRAALDNITILGEIGDEHIARKLEASIDTPDEVNGKIMVATLDSISRIRKRVSEGLPAPVQPGKGRTAGRPNEE